VRIPLFRTIAALLLAQLAACSAPAPAGGAGAFSRQDRSVAFADLGGIPLSVPVATIRQLRQTGTLLQEYDFSCGSAALATLLTHHYAEPVSEQEVLEAMYSLGDQAKIRREGFSMLDMKRYLEDIGYAADGFQQPLDKLAEARLPAIVLIDEGGYNHFVVIKGINGGRILLGDPARGIRVMSRRVFEAVWVGKLLFVIHNHQERVRFNARSDWAAAPRAPLLAGRLLEGTPSLPKLGTGDF
jgi:uncharacterized protein